MARRRFLAQLATWPLAALIPITTFPVRRSASLKYGNPKIFVSLIEWADHVITE